MLQEQCDRLFQIEFPELEELLQNIDQESIKDTLIQIRLSKVKDSDLLSEILLAENRSDFISAILNNDVMDETTVLALTDKMPKSQQKSIFVVTLSAHNKTSNTQLKALLNDSDWLAESDKKNLALNICKNPNCDEEILNLLADHQSFAVRLAVVNHEKTPQSTLEHMAKTEKEEDVLFHLLRKDNKDIAAAFTLNENSSKMTNLHSYVEELLVEPFVEPTYLEYRESRFTYFAYKYFSELTQLMKSYDVPEEKQLECAKDIEESIFEKLKNEIAKDEDLEYGIVKSLITYGGYDSFLREYDIEYDLSLEEFISDLQDTILSEYSRPEKSIHDEIDIMGFCDVNEAAVKAANQTQER